MSFRSGEASSWLNDQDWDEVTRSLNCTKHSTEKLVARLKTAATQIQMFRESIDT